MDEWALDAQVGRECAGQAYELASGLVNIELARGTRVAVEGPAVWRFVSDRHLQLDAGRIVAQVPRAAIGFTVVTPEAMIVDLGTEFGVEVDGQGRTDLHVIRGQVEIQSAPQTAAAPQRGRRVSAGEAMRVTADTAEPVRIALDQSRFPTVRAAVDVPALPSGTPGERAGATLDLVDLLAGGNGQGQWRNVSIDPRDGRCGDLAVLTTLNGDGAFHATPAHAVLDGCLMPNGMSQVDSAGHRFEFPHTEGGCCYAFWAGTRVPWLEGSQRLGTTNYGADGHVFLLMNSNKGLSLDLAAIRRLCGGKRIESFRAVGGNCIPAEHLTSARPGLPPPKTDLFVLVNGQLCYRREGLTPTMVRSPSRCRLKTVPDSWPSPPPTVETRIGVTG